MIIGHQNQKNKLTFLFQKKKIPHALLFTGPESVGKKTVARWFLKKINCKEKKSPCFLCRSCCEIEAKIHSDILEVYAEEKELKIKQIQEIAEMISHRPLKADFKGVLIDDAHLMNHYAQNALLKTLEEPTKKTVIILITNYPHLLLSTILSRVVKLKFYFVKKEDIEIGVKDKKIAKISCGRPGKAIEYLQFPQKLNEVKKLKEDVQNIFKEDIVSRCAKIKKIVEEEKENDFLVGLLETLREKVNKSVQEKREIKKYIDIAKETEDVIYFSNRKSINMRLALEKIIIKI